MKKKIAYMLPVVAALAFVFGISCQKQIHKERQTEEFASGVNNPKAAAPPFNMQVILRGADNAFGQIKFRQDNDAAKIIRLDTWIRGLEPNHNYILQRAVDAINVVDGNCTSTNWLTLGLGLTPQTILTDDKGTGKVELWRDITTIPTGSAFDIHFRILDASTMAVVLTSDCYEYIVR